MTSCGHGGLEVTTTAGAVRGVALDDDLATWRGVPYAASTAGDGRFRAPRPSVRWTGVRDASAFGAVPPQQHSPLGLLTGRRARMDEDCLTVNVVAPRAPGPPRPVMVWVYGGAYAVGASSMPLYGGHELARCGDVVFVSFNYRLGVLGFTDLTAHATPRRPIESNVGLRDQVAALQWVRDNIAAFGGDPGNVTLFGQSAGASSVVTLLAVPAARGLFHRAVAQSPAARFAYRPERTTEWGDRLVRLLGVAPGDATDALRRASAEALVAAGVELDAWTDQATPGAHCFAPTVDGDLLPAHPVEAAAQGATHPVPLVIGTVDREAGIWARAGITLVPTSRTLLDRMFALTAPAARDAVLGAYLDDGGDPVDVGGDRTFFRPAVEFAQGHATVAPTWMYRYDFAPRLLRLLCGGAPHISELPATFGATDSAAARVMTALGGRRALRDVSARVQEHWVHLARHGTPAPGWPTYDPGHRSTLIIDRRDHVEHDPRAHRRRAWVGFDDFG